MLFSSSSKRWLIWILGLWGSQMMDYYVRLKITPERELYENNHLLKV